MEGSITVAIQVCMCMSVFVQELIRTIVGLGYFFFALAAAYHGLGVLSFREGVGDICLPLEYDEQTSSADLPATDAIGLV